MRTRRQPEASRRLPAHALVGSHGALPGLAPGKSYVRFDIRLEFANVTVADAEAAQRQRMRTYAALSIPACMTHRTRVRIGPNANKF